ncbi:MAG: helix-turn-helix domain-containing protein [Devosia sp.]
MAQVPLSVTIEQAVEVTGIGRSKMFEAVREGKLLARKSGSRTIVLYSDLIKFIESLPVREVA